MKLYDYLKKLPIISTVNRLPEIGEVWQHGEDSGIRYMRINDDDGKAAMTNPPMDVFYSIDIDTGNVYWTKNNETDINVLKLGE